MSITHEAEKGIKIHVFLAHAGIASRRDAEQLVAEGKVTVNGKKAIIGQRVGLNDKVLLGDTHVIPIKLHRYFLVNKPVGYVSTTQDEHGRKTVLDLIPKLNERLYPVGRLDRDSEGLLLLTNDGLMANTLTHPKFGIVKTYQVQVKGYPSKKALDHLRRGVKLQDGYTAPAEVELLSKEDSTSWLEIKISEGRNRQIRRMTERVGYVTIQLIRTEFGPFSLDQLDGRDWIEIDSTDVQKALITNAKS